MQAQRNRKPRAANFTPLEQELLINLCSQNAIIDTKLNSAKVIQKKREAWMKILNVFVRTIEGSNRSVNELQGCWKRFKTSGGSFRGANQDVQQQDSGNPLDHLDMVVEGWDSTVDDIFEDELPNEPIPVTVKSEIEVEDSGSNEQSGPGDPGPSSSNLSTPERSPEMRVGKRKWFPDDQNQAISDPPTAPVITDFYERQHEVKMKMLNLKQAAVESKLSSSEDEKNLINLQKRVAEAKLELIQNQQILAVESLELVKVKCKAAKAKLLKNQIEIYKRKAECEAMNIKIPQEIWKQVDDLIS